MLRIFPFDKTGVSEAVAQFEENHDILLPEEYRTFLINYNGGNTLQTSFKIKKEFLATIKSKVYKIKSIDERIQKMKEVNSPVIVDDELKAVWQEEIDRYAGRDQVIVKL